MAASATSLEYVQKMFLAYFGRPVAPTGQEYYAQLVDAGNIAALQDDFWNSAESQAKFGSLTTEGKVNAIFNQLFGRDAAVSGLTYWTTEINAGRVSLPVAALTILNSASAADLEVFNAKLDVANAFTAELDTTAEILAYQSNLDAAVALLAGVKTAADADAVIADISNAVADVVAGGTTNPGQTFMLTTGVDTGPAFVGTAGNDTFVAGYDSAGEPTLTPFDNLDGAGGVDTLNVITAKSLANVPGVSVRNIENVNLLVAGDLGEEDSSFNMSTWTGVENLNVVATGSAFIDTRASVSVVVDAGEDATVIAGDVGTLTATADNDVVIEVDTADTISATAGEDFFITINESAVSVSASGVFGEDSAYSVMASSIVAGEEAATIVGEDGDVTVVAASADAITVDGADSATITVDTLGAVTIANMGDEDIDAEVEITANNNTALDLTLTDSFVGLAVAGLTGEGEEATSLETLNATVTGDEAGIRLVNGTLVTLNLFGATALALDTTVAGEDFTTIDAGAYTGDITATIGSHTYLGGSGVDVVTLGEDADLPSMDGEEVSHILDGGDGDADVLVVTEAMAETFSDNAGEDEDLVGSIRNFEILRLTDVSGEEVNIDATRFGINNIELESGEDLNLTLTVANAAGVSTNLGGDLTIVVDGADDEEADADDFSVSLALNGGEDGLDLTLTMADVGNLSVASNGEADEDGDVAAENGLTLAASALTTLTISGNAALEIVVGDEGESLDALTTVAAGGFDAGLTIDLTTVRGEGEDEDGVSITVGHGDNDIVGTNWDDVIVVGNGDNEIDGGAGNDTITVGNGDNIITGGLGADQITLGTGVNTLVYTAAAESSGLNIDVITGFNAGVIRTEGGDDLFNMFDFTAILGGEGFDQDANVTFLGSFNTITQANTALQNVDGAALQVVFVRGDNSLFVDVNGNGVIDSGDMAIELVGLVGTLSQDNFVASSVV